MRELLFSILTGFICGAVFALVRLPVPAPPVLAGVAGIFGLWAGYAILENVLN